MPQGKLQRLMWPMGGLVQNSPLADQAENTTTDCLNVRPYDSLDQRARGGKRTGLSKYFTALNGTERIQKMAQAVQAFDPTNLAADVTLVDQSLTAFGSVPTTIDGLLNWRELEVSGTLAINKPANVTSGTARIASVTHLADTYLHAPHAGADLAENRIMFYDDSLILGSNYILQATVDPPDNATSSGDRGSFGFFVRMNRTELIDASLTDTSGEGICVGWIATNQSSTQDIQVVAGVGQHLALQGGASTNIGSTFQVTPGTPVFVELKVTGNSFAFFIDGNLIGSFTSTSFTANNGFGYYLNAGSTAPDNNTPFIKDIKVFTAKRPASLRTSKIVAISGGNAYVGTPSGMSLASGGAGVLSGIVNDIGLQAAFQNVFMCDGTTANYNYLSLVNSTVNDWATDITGGTLPQGSTDTTLACRIMALYRGRIVMSGLQEEPQNWFMSKSGDPFDWDYSPATTSAIQAVAGNNTEAGLMGDVITCLAPYNDDIMIMGGANTLWIMAGDPAAGGQIDNVSHNIGIVGPDAWTFDTAGNFYFVGLNGFYRMPAGGGAPENLTRGRLDRVFRELDTAFSRVWVVYDQRWHGVHIFAAPTNEPLAGAIHYWWDERTNSFWPDQYPASFGPTAVLSYYDENPDNTGVLLGGYDSVVRSFEDANTDDDGTAISSFLRFAPIHPGKNVVNARVSDVNIQLDGDSGNAALNYFVGGSVEAAEAAADAGTARVSRTVVGGRNPFFRNRISGNAFILELEHNALGSTYAFEEGSAKVELLDRVKGRGV